MIEMQLKKPRNAVVEKNVYALFQEKKNESYGDTNEVMNEPNENE